jgi:hypothetical protein
MGWLECLQHMERSEALVKAINGPGLHSPPIAKVKMEVCALSSYVGYLMD